MRAIAVFALPTALLFSACTSGGAPNPIDTFAERDAQRVAIEDEIASEMAERISGEDLPDMGTATFAGAITIGIGTLPDMAGAMTLEADFMGNGSVSGEATSFIDENDVRYGGTLTLAETDLFRDELLFSIFSADLTGELSSTQTTINIDGTVNADFFGSSDDATDPPTFDPVFVEGSVTGTANVTVIGEGTEFGLAVDGDLALEQVDQSF